MKNTRGPIARIWAAVDGWVRSFSLRDADLYTGPINDDTGSTVTAKTDMQLDAAGSCVRLISETSATLPLSIYERTPDGGKRIAPQHPLHRIIHDRPNADSTAAVYWEAMIASMLLRGAGRAEKLYVGPYLVGISFLDPERLVITRNADGRRIYQYPRDDGTMREIPADRIWTIPGFTLDGRNGVSVIAYGAKVFGAAIAAEKAAAATFKNGLLQTIYYKVSSWLKPSQREEFKRNLAGSIQRGEMPLLEGGTEAGSMGINPVDAQLLESRAFSVEAICRWFRVPPWMVGHTEKSTSFGTGIEQQMIGFLTFTLAPWLRRIEQSINKDLLSPAESERYYAKFSVEGLLRADSAGRAAFYGAMVNNGILTRDEVRRLEDREPMGGNAAKLTVQSAMTTLDAVGGDSAGADPRATLRALLGFEAETQGVNQ